MDNTSTTDRPSASSLADEEWLIDQSVKSAGLQGDSKQPGNLQGNGEADPSLKDLIESSQRLQSEITDIFAKIKDLNRQVRIDIDDFCHIGVHNTTSTDNVRN